jgi:hypothetical protein
VPSSVHISCNNSKRSENQKKKKDANEVRKFHKLQIQIRRHLNQNGIIEWNKYGEKDSSTQVILLHGNCKVTEDY